ncbi:MAG: hypothetical protein SNH88_02530 [Rikenellaceae bacterium]
MKTTKTLLLAICMVCITTLATASPLKTIDTGRTIMKVRSAKFDGKPIVIASSYEGAILAISHDGEILWTTEIGDGIMNHDVWCADINGDGSDETLVASANGATYCLDKTGKVLWSFCPSETPMYAVCAVKDGKTSYVVCGGRDLNIYYLEADGKLKLTLPSSAYSLETPYSKFATDNPPSNICTPNFIRPIKKSNGKEAIVVLGSNNHMNVKGHFYLFDPLSTTPYRSQKVTTKVGRTLGDMKIMDLDSDGKDDIYVGASSHIKESGFSIFNLTTKKFNDRKIPKIIPTGYVVIQGVELGKGTNKKLMTVFGTDTYIADPSLNMSSATRISLKYAFNDIWCDDGKTLLIASEQSGGSCVYILDTEDRGWMDAYRNIKPTGKYAKMVENHAIAERQLASFQKPSYEREQLPIYLLNEGGSTAKSLAVLDNIEKNYTSPILLENTWAKSIERCEEWNRDTISNRELRLKRSTRNVYDLTHDEAVKQLTASLEGTNGMFAWGGHGNDPYYYGLPTIKEAIDKANSVKKPIVLFWPELGGHGSEVEYLMQTHIYPIAEYAEGKTAKMYMRTKDIFWLGSTYLTPWRDLLSGKYASVFVPSMEETTDKTMDLTIAGRVGIWASGAVDSWGTRAIMDNVSFDRSRQFGYQRLPSHFLRMLIYHTSYGASYINNFQVDDDYLSIYFDLIAKGLLYSPKREDILSFSPVHLGMKYPDEDYMAEGTDTKWTVRYDKRREQKNKMVFSRMNGTWPGAPVNAWDFSAYASGVKDRRLNFLPPTPNGLVLITPPQEGAFADKSAPRGDMISKLHPIYKDIAKEFITDGKSYFSADGKRRYVADEYYKVVAEAIEEGAKKLPISLEGEDVAWVLTQIDPTHLRLTLIDGGYINPDDRTAKVRFNTIKPVKVTDLLSGEMLTPSSNTMDIGVPCGLFRFIEIELPKPL